MRLIFSLVFTALAACATPLHPEKTMPPQEIGWIDREVLSDKDLKIVSDISPLNGREHHPPFLGHYWDCFKNADQVRVDCTKANEKDAFPGARFVEFVYEGSTKRFFYVPRMSDEKTCARFKIELKQLTQNQKVICFTGAGGLPSKEGFAAQFIRLKTKLGCFSYNENDCAK